MTEEDFLRMAEKYGVRVGTEMTYPEYPERDFKELVLADTLVGAIRYETHFDDVKKSGRYVIIHPDPYRIRRVDDECKVEAMSYGRNKKLIWKREWFDGNYWRYFKQDPDAIWDHYDKMMTELVEKQPAIMMTHFAPYEVGVNFEYRNSPLNTFFYFNAQKYFEMFDHDAIWICGHVHDKKICEYENEKGKKIKILCNPNGYPGERRDYADTMTIVGDELKRGSRRVEMSDFIITI